MTRNGRRPKSDLRDCPPPNSLNAERWVLGSILLDPRRVDEVHPIVHPDDFYSEPHRLIYRRLIAMHRQGQAIDEGLLVEQLKQSGEWEAAGEAATIAEIVQAVPVSGHAAHYATIVKQHARRRHLIFQSDEVYRRACDLSVDPGLVAAEGCAALGELAEPPQPPEPPPFAQVVDCKGLLAMDLRPHWHVRGILAAGKPTVIGGRSKTLKTSLAVDLVVSLGSGSDFLGKFTAERINVGFWSGESGSDTLRETAVRIADAKGVDLADCSIWWGFDLPKLGRPDHLEILANVIDQHALQVIVVDPLYLSLMEAGDTGKASDLFAMGSRLEPIGKLGQKKGCTVIVCHHFRKSGPLNEDEPAGLEELGQAGVAEWARQWLLLSRRSPYQADGHHELWMRTGGSSGHAGFWAVDIDEGLLDLDTMGGRKWEVDVRPVTEARQEAQRERETKKADEIERREGEHRDRVLEVLRDQPDWVIHRRLRVLCRMSGDTLERALITLEKEGRIETEEIHTKGGFGRGSRIVK